MRLDVNIQFCLSELMFDILHGSSIILSYCINVVFLAPKHTISIFIFNSWNCLYIIIVFIPLKYPMKLYTAIFGGISTSTCSSNFSAPLNSSSILYHYYPLFQCSLKLRIKIILEVMKNIIAISRAVVRSSTDLA